MLGHEDHIRIQLVDLLQVGLQNASLVFDHGVEASLACLDEAFRLDGSTEDEDIWVFDVRAHGFGRDVAFEDQSAHAGCRHAISWSFNGEHPDFLDEAERLRPYKRVHLHLTDCLQG